MATPNGLGSLLSTDRIPWTRREVKPELPEAEPVEQDEELDEEDKKGINLPAFKAARLMLEYAKKKHAPFQSSFSRDWRYLLGEDHYNLPKNALALRRSEELKNQGVRNWLFSTCDQKAGMLLEGQPKITAMPFAGPVSFLDRWRAQEVLKAECERLRVVEYHEDAMWDGLAVGKGLTRVIVRTDERSGMRFLELQDVDPSTWFPDPQASRLHQARYGTIEYWMDGAEIRRAFPKTYKRVTLKSRKFSSQREMTKGNSGGTSGLGRSRTDEEIVNSPGHDFTVAKNGDIQEQGAMVAFTYIVDEEVVEEIEERQALGDQEGYQCGNCFHMFEADPGIPSLNDFMSPAMMDEEPSPVSCPECGSEAVMAVTLPAEIETGDQIRRYRYPHGRLTVTTEDALLFDGANPDEVDGVFPLAEYPHYRVPRRYWGYGEVAHLKSAQIAADKNVTQLFDFLRTAVNGVLEFPQQAYQYNDLGNTPNFRIGLPPALIGLARYLPPPQFDLRVFDYVDQMVRRDFQTMSGITDITSGIAPTAPTSGDEVEARVEAGTVRMNNHRLRFDQYKSDLYNVIYQMAWQNYREERYFPVSDSTGRIQMIAMEFQKLPRNLRMTVTTKREIVKRSELSIQAMQQLMLTDKIPLMFDILLPMTGMTQDDADTLMSRLQLQAEEQKMAEQQQMQAASTVPAPPPGGPAPMAPEASEPAAPPLPAPPGPVPGGIR